MLAISQLLFAVNILACTAICHGCVVLQLYEHGLGANLNVLLSALPAFYGVNGTIYLDDRRFQYKCRDEGGYYDIFKAGIVRPYTGTKEQRSCAFYKYADPMRKPAVETAVVNCDGKYDPGIFQKVWRLQPQFQREVMKALKLLMTYKRPTVAFHVRGGDKVDEDIDFGRTTTGPVDLMNTYLDNFPGLKARTCLLFGDDPRRVTQMEQMVRRHIGCKVVHYGVKTRQAKGHDQEAFNIQPNEDKCDATKKLITDLELMAAADYFVGSGTSILPTIVGTLRQVLYRKPQVTQADVNYLDTGVRIRRFWGLGGFHNLTIHTAETEHSRSHADQQTNGRKTSSLSDIKS